MPALSVPNTFVTLTTALSAQVNANFAAIVTWSTTLDQTNFNTLTGALVWAISDASASAVTITNSSTNTPFLLTQSGVLAAGKSALSITSSSAQATGDAGLYVKFTNSSSSIPVVRVDNAGTGSGVKVVQTGNGFGVEVTNSGTLASFKSTSSSSGHVFEGAPSGSGIGLKLTNTGTALTAQLISTTRGALIAPLMTTAQRNAITPTTGEKLYNTDLKRTEIYSGAVWDRMGSRKNVVSKTTSYSATADDDVILCATASAWSLSLPAAANYAGRSLLIKKTSSDFNALTIDTNSTETIDGVDGTSINTQYETLEIASDGSNWHTVRRYVPGKTVAVTMTCGLTGGTNTVSAFLTRVGDRAFFEVDALFNPVFTGGTASFTLPTGLLIDTAKIAGTASAGIAPRLGRVDHIILATNNFVGDVYYNSASTVIVKALNDDSGTAGAYVSAGNAVTTTAPGTWANSDRMFLRFDVPISGWNG